MEISTTPFNLMNSGSNEGKRRETFSFLNHPRAVRAGRSSHAYEYTEEVKKE